VPPDEGTIRVILVDDHAVVRRGLIAFLESEPGIEVVGDADGGDAVLALIERLASEGRPPDVVLMDLQMSPVDGIESTRRIRERYDDVEVVALTSFDDVHRVQSALEAGASGYLLKDADVDEIAVAIRAAYRGDLQLDPAVARRLTESLRSPQAPELTSREIDVVRLLGEGQSNKAIAATLGITERTARTHVSNILAKLGLSSRTQAALWAARHEADAPRQRPPGAS